MKFTELPVHPALLKAIEEQGYVEATPVQAAVLGAKEDADLVVTSQTGSGKTVAYGLALATRLLAGKSKHPRALIIAPTRELALQVARELTWLYRPAGAVVATCVGGMDVGREVRSLRAGVDIVVGTPGRVCDHIERGTLKLDKIEAVVLDEADEMLDMGFRDELEKILIAAPAERRTLMFSATFPKGVESLAKKLTKGVERIIASTQAALHEDIEYIGHLVSPRERVHAVVNVLRFHDAASALVFCATREGVSHMHAALTERGFSAVSLSGELSQNERNRALSAMREKRARVLVATDVAARGLDLPAVALVIHADPPNDAEVFQHRSGRTGRAGKKGTAVLLVPAPRMRQIERGLRAAKINIKLSPLPTPDQIRSLDDQRLIHQVKGLVVDVDNNDIEVGRALLEQHEPNELAAILVRSLRRELPAAEEINATSWKSSDRNERDRGPRDEAPRGRFDNSSERRGPRPDDRGPPRKGPRYDREADAEEKRGQDDETRKVVDDKDGGVWFRVNVGRDQRADPKWLLPMLCRRGGITKRDLGTMEILRRETRFAVSPEAAKRFLESARKPDEKDPHIRIDVVK